MTRQLKRLSKRLASVILIASTFLGASCDEVLDQPWHKESYLYQHEQQQMRNIVDESKDRPANEMDGSVCKMPEYERMQEYDRINCHELLKACQKKLTIQ